MSVSFDGTEFKVLTLVYAYVDGRVLTLERGAHKAFLPGWFVAPGGKVEAEEDVVASGEREFFEETGLVLKGARLRGSYTFFTIEPTNRSGIIYLIVGDGVEGDFQAKVEDGTLHWLTVEELLASGKVMDDHKVWIREIFSNPSHFACVGSWKEGAVAAEWADSRGYFAGRKVA